MRVKLRKLYHAYKHTPEESPIYIKLEWEIYHLENMIDGVISCDWSPSEGCEKCKYKEECDLRGI